MERKIEKRHIIIGAITLLLGIGGIVAARNGHNEIAIINPSATRTPTPEPRKGLLSGKLCDRGNQRSLAVMYASDPEARPLSGIGSADMVIEMPVTQTGVTRMMGLFQCQQPSEYGSIRSARMDFIPLVLGFDALYLHWGGEQEALARLDAGIIDNIDCLKLDGSTCLRKNNRPRPHNGFSTPTLLNQKITQEEYRTTANPLGYLFEDGTKSAGTVAPPTLYSSTFAVRWAHDPTTNRYTRIRGGTTELDALTTLPVQADNIILLKTTSEYVSILYNRVKTTGSGTMTLYRNGTATTGKWEKLTDSARLVFKDAQSKEMKLNSGTTWIEIVTQ